ncbi:MAG TPA: phosphoglycerate mutase family protein [Acidimicrobiales bacterium]|nr:phosphoglycerate mutase family protein [Acidimicrobiales bacterium]
MIRDLAPTIREQVRRLLPGADEEVTAAPAAATTTTLLVVRHGHAGDRERWEGPDERRPLSKKGRRQAAGLVELLDGIEVARIVSSRYVRCLETVVPLACDRRLGIEVHPALAEGASVAELVALVAEVAGATTVLCTHGDVVWNMVVELAQRPAPEDGKDDPPMAKGSTWIVEAEGSRLAPARYLPPPSSSG